MTSLPLPLEASDEHLNNGHSARNPIEQLRDLLGHDVLLLPWPLGSKGTHRRWRHLTVESMTPDYLARIALGNIGVALGDASGGLCSIDIDADEFVLEFKGANPTLLATLQSRGARGCNFWIRFKGEYPRRTKPIKTGARITVPIHSDLLAHLNCIAGTDKPEVFIMPHMANLRSGGRHGLSEGFKRLMRKAGLDMQRVKSVGVRQLSRRTLHALRHSFTSALANQGVAPELRMLLTGHKTQAVHRGYSHHEMKILRDAVEKLDPITDGKLETKGA